MTLAQLRQLVQKWDLTNPDDSLSAAAQFETVLDKLEWFGQNRCSGYLPAQHPRYSATYMTRLAEWIGNVEGDDDRKTLLEYALQIAFFSHADICALYHTAFSGPITRWVIDQEGLSFDAPDFQTKLEVALYQETWYCPVTDSMDINEFYHSNHIVGVPYRPVFSLLKMLDKPAAGETQDTLTRLTRNLVAFMDNPNERGSSPALKRIVLLEDFVGSGTQSASTLTWAAKNLRVPILFMPLVVCAPGADKFMKIATNSPAQISFNSLLTLGPSDLLGVNRKTSTGMPNAARNEDLARKTFERVAGGLHTDPRIPPFTPFGFQETGASFVSYSNTPNNSLPLIHHKPATGSWYPLFPRSSRV